ncbi:hypothetical protein HNY73_003736 [Argiope bruennichi]|uniref:Uncharacterized protein n=1 Tax=Argiope bruennichi TaxID=94029 RepID=A0A8T0FRH2_ARGBR|nr:hypothetical protein HNY73_003736 [Argiope bruennichi]
MDTQDNWANRSTPTTQISKSLAPTSTSHIPTENPISPQTPNPDVSMISPSSQIQKIPQNDFQIVSPKKAAKKPRTEENFKITTENSYSHLQEESDRPPKSIAPISLVIKENYNLILQEIMRRYPETENHFQRAAWKGCPAIPRAQTQSTSYPRRSYAEATNKNNSQNINPTLPRSQEVTHHRPINRKPQPPQPTLIDELNDIKELKNHLNDLKEIKELLIEFPNILNAIRLSKKAKSKQEKLLIFIDALIAEEPTP